MADRVGRVLEPMLAAADEAFGSSYSAVLYGSAARGDFIDGRSNINLLLVLDDVGPASLRSLGPAVKAWRAKTPEPPLLVSRAEWNRATDVFPLEITDMQASYRLLRGMDPLAGMRVARADLRHALETELRGKLLRLRQGYTLFAAEPADLGALATQSVSTALVLFRALLVLLGRPIAPASAAERIVREAAMLVGFAPDGVVEVVRHRADEKWRCEAAIFEGYLDAVTRTALHVDQLQPGDD